MRSISIAVALMAPMVLVSASWAAPAKAAALKAAGPNLILPDRLSKSERHALVARTNPGDVEAMRTLGWRALRVGPLYFEFGSWGDVEGAKRWWRKAADLGDPAAMILLGHLYAEPWGVAQDLPEAAKWFRLAADKGQLEAVQDLAALYMGEWSDERDDDQASIWLHRAAAMGDEHSMLLLGLRYDAGWGVREDAHEAASWYRLVISKARPDRATEDQSEALNNLGVMYEKGRGVPQDYGMAASLYARARADFNLARLCEAGLGVAQDREGALWLYRNVALFNETPDVDQALKRLGYVTRDQDTEARALLDHDQHEAKTPCAP
jgi:TPR repeat protein